MAFKNVSMTQGTTTDIVTSSSILEGKVAEVLDTEVNNSSCNSNSVNYKRPHHLFRKIKVKESDEDSNGNQSGSSSSASLYTHMSQPSPSEIRQWMADTQETVGRMVTNWQQEIILRSSNISDILNHLVRYVFELEGSSASSSVPPIMSSKILSSHGTFESVINIYLHMILVTLKQVTFSKDTRLEQEEGEEGDLRKLKFRRIREHRLLIEILRRFSILAEDALRFLQTHKKVLAPACEKVLDMRNNLYYFLCEIVESHCQIVPLVAHVSLEEIRREENRSWLEQNCEDFKKVEKKMPSFLKVMVAARDCWLVVEDDEEDKEIKQPTKMEMTVYERLELMLLLLKQLDLSIGSSNKALISSQHQFLEGHTKLMMKFQRFVRRLVLEKRKDKLNSESCSEPFKESLCQLEVKFHQVEKILEEIPMHMRRVIGVADHCSRLMIHKFGLWENLEMEESSSTWVSPIEEISGQFFKSSISRGIFLPTSCFPYFWRIIARVFFRRELETKKLKAFWEEVNTEMEDFHKEIKIKELDFGYGVSLKIPFHLGGCDNDNIGESGAHLHRRRWEELSKSLLTKYVHNLVSEDVAASTSTITETEAALIDNHAPPDTIGSPPDPDLNAPSSIQTLFENVPIKKSPTLPTYLKAVEQQPIIVKEFKYVSKQYSRVDKQLNQFTEEDIVLTSTTVNKETVTAPPAGADIMSCCNNLEHNCDICCSNVRKLMETAHHADELKRKLYSYHFFDEPLMI